MALLGCSDSGSLLGSTWGGGGAAGNWGVAGSGGPTPKRPTHTVSARCRRSAPCAPLMWLLGRPHVTVPAPPRGHLRGRARREWLCLRGHTHLCHLLLFVRSESLGLAHIRGRGRSSMLKGRVSKVVCT